MNCFRSCRPESKQKLEEDESSVDPDNEEKFQQLLERLSPDDMQTAASVIQMTLLDASANALAKSKVRPKNKIPKHYTSNIKSMHKGLLKKLDSNDQKIFNAAIEQAKINGAQQPSLVESIYG
ncbi:unnamed protein product [Adineta steineri]|uniref:Uncharacterized protein n=1 Tax=Adineta steineri TaxID=433720 RepID=A0A819G851_9BILA|nr:unnamed protein product [Adineta steineri]